MVRFLKSRPFLYGTLLSGGLLCGGLRAVLIAQETSGTPSTPPETLQTPSTQTFLERDPLTGGFRMFLLLPSGEKKLLQTFPPPQRRLGTPLSATDADYLNALGELATKERYFIGVELKTIPAGLHKRLGIDDRCGLVVAHVLDGKPAAEAGIKQYDLLLKINGKPVNQPGDVVRMVNEGKGAPLTLTILRDKSPVDITVIPAEATPEDFAPSNPIPSVTERLPAGVLPPGAQVVGPGMILPSHRSADIEMLHADLAALQKQVKSLCEEVQRLEQELKK